MEDETNVIPGDPEAGFADLSSVEPEAPVAPPYIGPFVPSKPHERNSYFAAKSIKYDDLIDSGYTREQALKESEGYAEGLFPNVAAEKKYEIGVRDQYRFKKMLDAGFNEEESSKIIAVEKMSEQLSPKTKDAFDQIIVNWRNKEGLPQQTASQEILYGTGPKEANPEIGKVIGEEINAGTAWDTLSAGAKEYYKGDSSNLMKALYTINLSSQFSDRQIIAGLAKMGMLGETDEQNREMAIKLLAQEDSSLVDLINTFWHVDNAWEGAARIGAGFIAEVAADPMTWIPFLFPVKMYQKAMLVGSKAHNIEKMGSGAQQLMRAGAKATEIIAKEKGVESLAKYQTILDDFVTKGGPVEDFIQKVEGLSPDQAKNLRLAMEHELAPKTILDEYARGERAISFLPFDMAMGEAAPKFTAPLKAVGKVTTSFRDFYPKMVFASAANEGKSSVSKAGRDLWTIGASMRSGTSSPIYNSAHRGYLAQSTIDELETQKYITDSLVHEKRLTELYGTQNAAEVNKRISYWLERGPVKDPYELLKKFGHKIYVPEGPLVAETRFSKIGEVTPIQYVRDVFVKNLFDEIPTEDRAITNLRKVLKNKLKTKSLTREEIINYAEAYEGFLQTGSKDYLSDDLINAFEDYRLATTGKKKFTKALEVETAGKKITKEDLASKLGLEPKELKLGKQKIVPGQKQDVIEPYVAEYQPIRETGKVKFLTEMKPEDVKVLANMNEYELETVDKIRAIHEETRNFMKSRPEIPFEEFNPFLKMSDRNPRGYHGHMISEEGRQYLRDLMALPDSELTPRERFIVRRLGLGGFTKSRGWRASIEEINKQVANISDGKIKEFFITDPYYVAIKTNEEARRIARNFDLIKKIEPIAVVRTGGARPPVGYVPFDIADFTSVSGFGISSMDELKYAMSKKEIKNALPTFFADISQGKQVYVPHDVYDSLKFMLAPQSRSSLGRVAIGAMTAFNHMMRNNLLFGLAYNGKNFTSNFVNFWSLPGNPVTKLQATKDVLWTMNPMRSDLAEQKSIKILQDGQEVLLSPNELRKMMMDNAILDSGVGLEPTIRIIGDGVRSAVDSNRKVANKGMSLIDAAFLWKYNREAAQKVDNVFKGAHFLSLLKSGYTPEAAAEAVEKYFYLYGRMGRGQAFARETYPFTSFSFKTAERMADDLARFDFARMTLPYKIKQTLTGNFIMDEETQSNIEALLPSYARSGLGRSPVMLLPGGKLISAEIPHPFSSLSFFSDPGESLHPAYRFIGQILGVSDSDKLMEMQSELTSIPDSRKRYEAFVNAGYDNAPIYIKLLMDAMAKKNPDGFPTIYKKYMATAAGVPELHGNVDKLRRAFSRDVETGQWLFSALFPNENYKLTDQNYIDSHVTAQELTKLIGETTWIQKHFSQIALGSVSMTNLDRYVVMHTLAANKAITQLQNIRNDDLQRAQLKVDPNERQKAGLAIKSKAAAEILKIKDDLKTTLMFYEYYKKAEDKHPGLFMKAFGFGDVANETILDEKSGDEKRAIEMELYNNKMDEIRKRQMMGYDNWWMNFVTQEE